MVKTDKKALFQKKIELRHLYPEDLKSYFITNVIVQHQADHFILSFFESFSPPILGETEEEKEAQLEKIKHIDANCVSRLIVTPGKMRELVKVFAENLKNYDEKSALKSEDHEEVKR